MSLYERHYSNPRRERAFLSAAGFTTAFATARAITHSIRAGIGPFHNLSADGRHIHHSTFGILGLLGCGYVWTYQWGVGIPPGRRWLSRDQRHELRGGGGPDARRVRALARSQRRLLGQAGSQVDRCGRAVRRSADDGGRRPRRPAGTRAPPAVCRSARVDGAPSYPSTQSWPIRPTSATSRSSPTSTTASRRWPTASSS